MTDEPEDPDREYNLWEPVDDDEDHGTHGRFDDQARDRSYLLWATIHQKSLSAAGLLLIALIAGAISRWRESE